MYFYKKNKKNLKIEKQVTKNIQKLISKINNDESLSQYILNFGLVGPTGRGQGFYYNNKIKSDFDFYFITKTINPFLSQKINNIFNKIFKKELNCSTLIVYKGILKKPDLIFFEYSNSGMQLFGEKIKPITFNNISKFESFRNIIYRSCFFLNLFIIKNNKLILKKVNKEQFLYYYSKVIFAIGEIELIINNKYIADNFKRNKLIEKLNNDISKEHSKMHSFRYHNINPKDFNYDLYIDTAIKLLNSTYQNLFKELISEKNIKKVHPNIISRIINKIIFIKSYKNNFGKYELNLEEDFIVLIIKHYQLIKNLNKKNTVTNNELETVLNYWKTAGWFYYKL